MLKRFSVGYTYEKNKKNQKDKLKFEESLRKSIIAVEKKKVLSESLVEYMLSLGKQIFYKGFSIDQIRLAHNTYKFSTIEEAVNIMMKDPESNKYLHIFLQDDKQRCKICSAIFEEHDNYSLSARDNEENEVRLSIGNDSTSRSSAQKELKKVEIEIPKSLLDNFEAPDICRICFDNKIDDSSMYNFYCQHKFCRECVKNYLATAINDGRVINIKCLYGGCPRQFTSDEIKSHVTQDSWKKFRKFLFQKTHLSSPEYKNCPYPDCEEIVQVDPLEVQIFNECDQHHRFCSKCMQVGWHREGRCEKVKLSLL